MDSRLRLLEISFTGRVVHSLALALSLFNTRLFFVSPPSLAMPESICRELRQQGVLFSCHQSIEEVVDRIDILFMTRVQKERFASPKEYQKLKDHYIFDYGSA